MSTPDTTTSSPAPARRRTSSTHFVAAFTAGAVAVAAIAAVYASLGDTETALGALTGGGFVLLLMIGARWRSTRRPASAGTAARLGAGLPDERDRTIVTGALSLVGAASFLFASAGLACVVAGLDAAAVLGVMVIALAATFVVALVVLERRG
jgi:hypothetical protein